MTAVRTLRLAAPLMRGDDVLEFQRKAQSSKWGSFAPQRDGDGDPWADGVYGTSSEAVAVQIRYALGYPLSGSNNYRYGIVGPRLMRFLRGDLELPEEYAKRRKTRQSIKIVRPLPTPLGNNSEFTYQDAEGAPDANGVRRHAGKDWFAPGGTPLVSPVVGEVVEARHSSDDSGQVFGGAVKIQGPKFVHVFRHVFPLSGLSEGDRVRAAEQVAAVTRWRDWPGGSHAHCELWLTLSGGYRYENMRDPLPYYQAASPAS